MGRTFVIGKLIMKRALISTLSLFVLIGCVFAAVGLAQTHKPAAKIPQIKFSDYRLANGLRVLLSQEAAAKLSEALAR